LCSTASDGLTSMVALGDLVAGLTHGIYMLLGAFPDQVAGKAQCFHRDSMNDGEWDAEEAAGEMDHRAGMAPGRWDGTSGDREDGQRCEAGPATERDDLKDPVRLPRPRLMADGGGSVEGRRACWSGGDHQESESFRMFQPRVRQCRVLWRYPRRWALVGDEMSSAWAAREGVGGDRDRLDSLRLAGYPVR
jgi:hypothetical protein